MVSFSVSFAFPRISRRAKDFASRRKWRGWQGSGRFMRRRYQRQIQGISRPRAWQRSTIAGCSFFPATAAQSSSWLPWLWHLWQW